MIPIEPNEMADKKLTPRGLIDKVLDSKKPVILLDRVSPKALSSSPVSPRGRLSMSSSHGLRQTSTRPGHKRKHSSGPTSTRNSHMLAPSEVTPRTLVANYIAAHDSQPALPKRHRTSSPSKKTPPARPPLPRAMSPRRHGQSPKGKNLVHSPRSKRKSVDLRKKATMKNFLQKDTTSDKPTPRSMITNLIAEGMEESMVASQRTTGPIGNDTTYRHDMTLGNFTQNSTVMEESYLSHYTQSQGSQAMVPRPSPKQATFRRRRKPNIGNFSAGLDKSLARHRKPTQTSFDLDSILEHSDDQTSKTKSLSSSASRRSSRPRRSRLGNEIDATDSEEDARTPRSGHYQLADNHEMVLSVSKTHIGDVMIHSPKVGSPRGSEVDSPRGSEMGSPRGSKVGSPRGSEEGSHRGSEVSSPQGSEEGSPRGSNVGSPPGSEVGSPRGSEVGSPRGSVVGSPRGSEVGSPRGSEVGTPRGSKVGSARGSEEGSPRDSEVGSPRGTQVGSPRGSEAEDEASESGDESDTPQQPSSGKKLHQTVSSVEGTMPPRSGNALLPGASGDILSEDLYTPTVNNEFYEPGQNRSSLGLSVRHSRHQTPDSTHSLTTNTSAARRKSSPHHGKHSLRESNLTPNTVVNTPSRNTQNTDNTREDLSKSPLGHTPQQRRTSSDSSVGRSRKARQSSAPGSVIADVSDLMTPRQSMGSSATNLSESTRMSSLDSTQFENIQTPVLSPDRTPRITDFFKSHRKDKHTAKRTKETIGEPVTIAAATQRNSNKTRSKGKKSLLPRIPKSVTKSLVTRFTNSRIPKETLAAIEDVADDFFKNAVCDLAVYAQHAHRQGLDESDVELLMKRQGFVTDRQPMYALVEKYLPLEYREEIIPVTRCGNKVVPKY